MLHGRLNIVCALVLLLAWSPGLAAQRDRKPPKIVHAPVSQAEQGLALEIRAQIEDPSGVFEPTLFYRSAGSREYLRATLASVAGEYVATIPAAAVVGEIEYFVEAFDEQGNGPARVGSPGKPLVVQVLSTTAALPGPGTTPANGAGTTTPAGNGSTGSPSPDDASGGSTTGNGSALDSDGATASAAAGSDEDAGDGVLIAAIAGGAGALLLGGVGAAVLVWALFLNTPEPPGSVTVVVTAPPPVQSLQVVP